MEQLLNFLIENTSKGNLSKEIAVEMAKIIKQNDIKNSHNDIAIIGIAGKLPLAKTIDEYWKNVRDGADAITSFPKSRSKDITNYLRAIGTPEEEIQYTQSGFLENVDTFDHRFFRMSKKEASLMDPPQRMFLETAWQVIEDAGYGGDRIVGTNTGIYAGFASNFRDMYIKQVQDVSPEDIPYSLIGNLSAVLPSRISYLLDLKGPSIMIDTACSSSLVSVTQACEAIRTGKCDMAIAGGVNVNLMPVDNPNLRMGIESSDNRTRAFHEGSDGAAVGEGVAAVMLKPLKKAKEDGDHVYSVIKGAAVNQDGNSVGLTAPNPAAQTDVIVKAWEDASIDPESVSYIETHGTGTKLGDPIEIRGIKNAFEKYTDKKQFCAISSVKTNIGHLSEAAGVVSLIKLVMALRNKKIPPSLYFDRPNSKIPFIDSPVYVNTKVKDWKEAKGVRRGGVSSFGISGTNCHVVVEEAPAQNRIEPLNRPYYILSLSAGSEQSLLDLAHQYKEKINKQKNYHLGDICYTTHTGRGHHMHRLAIVFSNAEELIIKLENVIEKSIKAKLDGVYYGVFKTLGNKKNKQYDYEITEEYKLELNQEAEKYLEKIITSNNSDLQSINMLCDLYVQGGDVNWEKLYEGEQFVKVSLPTYPFEPTRCWLDIPENMNDQGDYKEDNYYDMVWYESPLDQLPERDKKFEGVLLFKDNNGVANQLADKLKQLGAQPIIVEFGDTFMVKKKDNYIISGEMEDYTQLFTHIKNVTLSHIIHLTSLDNPKVESFEEFSLVQKQGVYGIYYLLKELVEQGLDQNIDLFVVSRFVSDVVGDEPYIAAENAPLMAIGKNITQEHQGILCRGIDVDEEVNVEELLQEMQVKTPIYRAAYRSGKRFTEEFLEQPLDNMEDDLVSIKENGVYFISGGMGGLGLEMAKFLATDSNVTLILTSRSTIPDRSEWKQIIQSAEQVKIIKKIEAIKEIEKQGSRVIHYAVDSANYDEMKKVINEVRNKYKTIDGVIHAAGVPGDGLLCVKDESKFNEVIRPKVHGTWALDQLTRNDNLDFFITYSSGLSILSEPGHGDYTAANAYLDSFTDYRNKEGQKTLSINWTTWNETGMAVEYGFDHDSFFKTINTEMALSSLINVLNKKKNKVLIGQMNDKPEFLYMLDSDRLPFKLSDKLRNRVEQILQSRPKREKPTNPKQNSSSDDVDLIGKDNSEFSAIEKRVAQIYCEVLGATEINIEESFFELGGDSLMVNRMHAILDEEFPGVVKLIDLFNYASIETLSDYISSNLEPTKQVEKKESSLEDFADMIEDLEKGDLSVDDAIKKFE